MFQPHTTAFREHFSLFSYSLPVLVSPLRIQVKCLSPVNSTVIPKRRNVENAREIFLRAALKVTVIFRKHDVTLKFEVLPVLCFRTTKLDNRCVTNSSDLLRSFGM
jgi:hypothetical protein